MALWIWLPITLVALLALGLMAAARRAALGVDPTRLTFSPELMAEVGALAKSGRMVAAVNLLRQQNPGLSLVHAKQLVDRLAARGPAAATAAPPPPADPAPEVHVDPDSDRAPSDSSVPLEVELQVRGLVAADEPAAALRTLRAATGWDSPRAEQYLSTLR